MNPTADIPVANNYRAGFRKDAIARDVIDMVVRVYHEFHGKLSQLLDFGKELFRGCGIHESVDDRDAVVADYEAGVRSSGAFRTVDGRIDVVAKWLDREGQGSRRRGGCLRVACAREE